ncbi:hypothetical protein HD806DRAFT_515875 [Xylariaceae sp. AK1471]|nr:hypothetical protein HD806DRAFT_515875 [Xylariaceae sp. AK1471]
MLSLWKCCIFQALALLTSRSGLCYCAHSFSWPSVCKAVLTRQVARVVGPFRYCSHCLPNRTNGLSQATNYGPSWTI